MDLEAHFQNLASLNINSDEIENEQYAKAFNSLFAIVEILSKENIAQKEQIQMLRDEINLLKGNKPNQTFVVLKKKMTSLLNKKGIKENLIKTGNLIQE